jgi:hypothetical protein
MYECDNSLHKTHCVYRVLVDMRQHVTDTLWVSTDRDQNR